MSSEVNSEVSSEVNPTRSVGFFRDPSGRLTCDGADLSALAEEYATPLYLYSEAALIAAWTDFQTATDAVEKASGGAAQALVCYSLKANPHLALVSLLRGLGAGADLVSGGELARALAAGVPPEKIVFAGVAKSQAELRQGVAAGILQFNIESESELHDLNAIAEGAGRRVSVALRYNPDVGGGGSDKITTGRAADKFGLSHDTVLRIIAQADGLSHLDLAGLSVHIGSQVFDTASFRAAWQKLLALFQDAQAAGCSSLRRADLGGGLGISYSESPAPTLQDYAHEVAGFTQAFVPLAQTADGEKPLVLFEPGRRLVARAGGLLTRVLRVKDEAGRRFVLLDAAMNDLIRPALYGTEHRLEAVAAPVATEGALGATGGTIGALGATGGSTGALEATGGTTGALGATGGTTGALGATEGTTGALGATGGTTGALGATEGTTGAIRGSFAGISVAGPICETSDVFLPERKPEQASAWSRLQEGELAVFLDTGAYGATMASAYNSRPPCRRSVGASRYYAQVHHTPPHSGFLDGKRDDSV